MLLFFSILLLWRGGTIQAQLVPALFAFGDSLVDAGNNNFLQTVARANHPPYGCSFENQSATGRFSDGMLIPDLIALRLGLPYPPPYLAAGENIYNGVNFGSASSGISPLTGQGFVMSLSDQVDSFREVQFRMVRRMGRVQALRRISSSIFYLCTANNDINNFVIRFRGVPVPAQMRNGLLLEFSFQLQRLYNLGARKFVVVGLSAVGCVPMNQFYGQCSTLGLAASTYYNTGLSVVLNTLRNSNTFRGIQIVLTNLERLMIDVKSNPGAYGFTNAVQGCCPMYEPWRWCFDGGEFCEEPSQFMFWDLVHTTQAFNQIAVDRWWNSTDSRDVSPMSILELAELEIIT